MKAILKEAQALYDTTKKIAPLDTKFHGNLKEVIVSATDEQTYTKLEGMGLTNADNIDGLLDYLYGDKAMGGMFFDVPTIEKLIKAVEQNTD